MQESRTKRNSAWRNNRDKKKANDKADDQSEKDNAKAETKEIRRDNKNPGDDDSAPQAKRRYRRGSMKGFALGGNPTSRPGDRKIADSDKPTREAGSHMRKRIARKKLS